MAAPKSITEKVEQEVQSALSVAEEALANSDNMALFNQVRKSEEARAKLAKTLDAVIGTYADDSIRRPAPVFQPPNDNAIDAMREVALACVELAKAVVAAK